MFPVDDLESRYRHLTSNAEDASLAKHSDDIRSTLCSGPPYVIDTGRVDIPVSEFRSDHTVPFTLL